MVNSTVFLKRLTDILNELYDKEYQNMEEAANMIAQCFQNNGVVHVFGTGHSVGFGIDLQNRVGSFVPLHIMQMTDFVTKGSIPYEVFTDKNNIFERKVGVAKDFMELYEIHPNDMFIIISNSGINGIVIDLADLAKQKGHKIITITSMKHTMSEDSRHPSGKKLYEYGDLVIDNCGPIGDALLETDGIEKVCSVSSICGNCIAQAIAARVCEILIHEGVTLPVLKEENCEENKAFNQKLKEYYHNRV